MEGSRKGSGRSRRGQWKVKERQREGHGGAVTGQGKAVRTQCNVSERHGGSGIEKNAAASARRSDPAPAAGRAARLGRPRAGST